MSFRESEPKDPFPYFNQRMIDKIFKDLQLKLEVQNVKQQIQDYTASNPGVLARRWEEEFTENPKEK